MPERPAVKSKTVTSKMPERMVEFFDDMRKKVTTNDVDSVSKWKEKMRIARNMRQGIKRITDFPYPDAPDIPLPETDKVIRKQKPRFVLAVLSGKKLMDIRPLEGIQEVNPEMMASAKRTTIAMNWLFKRSQMEWKRKLTLAADWFLEKGHSIFKCVECYDSRLVNRVVDTREYEEEDLKAFRALSDSDKREFLANRYGLDPDGSNDSKTLTRIIKEFKAGKKVIRFTTEEVSNLPDVTVPLPEKVYVPRGTTNIEEAPRITNEFFWTENDLIKLAMNDVLDKERVLDLLKKENRDKIKRGDDDENEQVKDTLEGISGEPGQSELFRVHETITWYQPKDGAMFERWVFVYFPDISDAEEAIIQRMPYPFEFKGWNYVKHDNEVIDDRYYSSRGVPEQIRAIQEFMERATNNMLIRDEINNAPMFTVKRNANIQSDTVRFIPGQRINVNNHDDIKQLNENSKVDVSSERIMQQLKAFAEEYVGIPDQLFRNATNAGGGKTLGEIQIGVTESQFTANLDINLWIESIRKVYEKTFYIMRERLTQPLNINGETITREDFMFEPEITVNGNLEMADKALQAQRAVVRLDRARQAKQDGVATGEDLFRAYEDYLEKDGVKEPLDFITDPKTVAKEQITLMENQVAQLGETLKSYHSEIAQADNTLRQLQMQIAKKKNTGGDNGEVPNRQGNSRQAGRAG